MDLVDFVVGDMQDLESRVARNDVHRRVAQTVARQVQLLHLVQVRVVVQLRQLCQSVLGAVQHSQSVQTRACSL